MELQVRKAVSFVDTTKREMGRHVDGTHRKVATAIVFGNPFAGRYETNVDALVDLGAELGRALVDEALAVLRCAVEEVSARDALPVRSR